MGCRDIEGDTHRVKPRSCSPIVQTDVSLYSMFSGLRAAPRNITPALSGFLLLLPGKRRDSHNKLKGFGSKI